MLEVIATSLVCVVGAFLVGVRVGGSRTKKRFHALQDSGELIVLTKKQFEEKQAMKALLAGDEPPYKPVSYKRRDNSVRREDWGLRIKHGLLDENLDEAMDAADDE